jgi:betaine reductase
MTPVAVMIGSNRIIRAAGIAHPLGNPDLHLEAEKELRRAIMETAIKALQTGIQKQRIFEPHLA